MHRCPACLCIVSLPLLILLFYLKELFLADDMLSGKINLRAQQPNKVLDEDAALLGNGQAKKKKSGDSVDGDEEKKEESEDLGGQPNKVLDEDAALLGNGQAKKKKSGDSVDGDEEKKEESEDLDGSFDPPGTKIIIDYAKIRSMDKSPLERVKNLTTEEYELYLLADAGIEHYAFLNYLSATYGDHRHFTDIGTRVVASSVAVGSNLKSPVWTFDLPTSYERQQAFRGDTEEEWQTKAHDIGLNVTFHNLDLMKASNEELKKYLDTWFVLLDTFHQPDTVPFEREFFQRMLDIGFKGILCLDDIHLNHEMKKWWNEVQDGAEGGGYRTYDITEIGHYSGTGLVDFSGKVTVNKS
uniref:Uncharacterized protein n=1 Tax=Ditylum brightwellii TaxID=49249 RepID=A0A7S4QYG6_9STRA